VCPVDRQNDDLDTWHVPARLLRPRRSRAFLATGFDISAPLHDATEPKRLTQHVVSMSTSVNSARILTPDPVRGPVGAGPTSGRGRSLANKQQARDAAIRSLARDLTIDLQEAERWCSAWERFVRRHGGARGNYFWEAGRGWIDAQRAMGLAPPSTEAPPARVPTRSSTSIAQVRRIDRAS